VTDDSRLLEALRTKLEPRARARYPPVALDAVRAAEARVGFSFPPLLVRIWTELQNGGFGPGTGVLGVPPRGYVDDDLGAEDIVAHYLGSVARALCPPRVVALCNWGCAIWSYVDCNDHRARVISSEGADTGDPFSIRYCLSCDSLNEWLSKWLAGVSLFDDMHEVVGHRESMNPFTRRPTMRPVLRLRGTVVYLAP